MTAVGIGIGLMVIVVGLILCTDRIDQYWRNRTPRMGALVKTPSISITPLWQPAWAGICSDCKTEDEPDRWLPHLCYECAELARVKARNERR